MKLLVHFPTKGRRDQATKTIAGYISLADAPHDLSLSLACNSPADVPEVKGWENVHPTIPAAYGSKIEAYNAVPMDMEWDVVLAASDDMWCVQPGWDTIVREAMQAHFPNLDGCLWFSDGRQDRICTFSIMGRKAYEEDGYIYHSSYLSFFCDNEWTEVWQQRGRMYADPRVLFRNEHPAWGGVMPNDGTYKANDRAWNHDKHNYHARKIQGFPK